MKKIDFVIGSLVRGGAEHVISILANHYSELGYDVNVILLLHGAIQYDLNPKVKIIHLYGKTNNRLFRIPYWIKNLKQHFKNREPDYVVSFVCRINLLTMYSLKNIKTFSSRARIVISERNDPRYDGRGIFAKLLTHIFYPLADSIIVQSSEIQNLLPEKVRNKSHVVLNPIDIKTNYVEPCERDNIIITNGRLTKQKNQILLIKAFEILIKDKKSKGFQLHIYGNGELKEKLEKYVDKHHLKENIYIFENTPLIQEKVAKSKIFVLPSIYEGLSNSLMEALALGVPSISTPVSGSSSIIDYECGIVTKSFSVKELSHALDSLISVSDAEYYRLACEAKKKSISFSLPNILEKYDEIILNANMKE